MFSLVKWNLRKSYAVFKGRKKGRNELVSSSYTYNLLSFWKEILDFIVNLIQKS